MKQLILASQSPRRKELLEKCGVPFTVDAADIDEQIDPSKSLEEEIQRLAHEKARVVLMRHPSAVVVGSDTVVTLDKEVLGKPKDREDAKRMLRELSGRTHQVITGLSILSADEEVLEASVSEVTFKNLSEEEIETYVASAEADDKAGAYGIQGRAACFITCIKGDYYSIMGLPVHLVYEGLRKVLGRAEEA